MESEYKLVIHYNGQYMDEELKLKTKSPVMVSRVANALLREQSLISSIDIHDVVCMDRLIATRKR